ncbi:MAG: WecB/TagA/CpsF family glycosyltransferase [Candidatus Nanoarchaeia archaeon]|nr:WecB/TagA/CpsF family glycosyltransferase [Candidatus Jingweiarchaeum tengchongense]
MTIEITGSTVDGSKEQKILDDTENILGFQVVAVNRDMCLDAIVEIIKSRSDSHNTDQNIRTYYLACINPHSIYMASKDPIVKQALLNADILVPDGIGIILASRLRGGRIRGRITGSDIFEGVSERLNECGGFSYFFLGSTHRVLEKIREKMSKKYPRIRVAGVYSPPFSDVVDQSESNRIVDTVNQVSPDVLWVGMTAPKQEKWIFENRYRLRVKFIGAIGAVFDFFSGEVKRPGAFFQRLGLEWLGRFMRQPRRLWRRTVISAPWFLMQLLKYTVK